MQAFKPTWVTSFVSSWALCALMAGCGGDGGGVDGGPDGGVLPDGATSDGAGAADLSTGGADLTSGPPMKVSFYYQPLWAGVTAVEVIGGFGQTGDWTQPLVQLAKQLDGSFSGDAQLPAGQYAYLFLAHGDGNAAVPATFKHYALDPADPAFAACPAASPTFSAAAANPCSQLSVPQAAAPTLYTVKGQVTYDAKPVAGYLAVLEREEAGSHHFFANLMATDANGAYSFQAAAGQYRVQVQHPSIEKLTDAARDPLTLQAARRVISASFPVAANVAVGAVETAYHDYNKIQPTGTAKLPTTFQFTLIKGAVKATLDVYGLAAPTAKGIGDPWYASPAGAMTSVTFDGKFTTTQAKETSAKTGEQYYFGTEQQLAHAVNQPAWTLQSMVLPITFQ